MFLIIVRKCSFILRLLSLENRLSCQTELYVFLKSKGINFASRFSNCVFINEGF